MLTISSKCKYGILAALSLAENYGQGLLQIKDIAAKNSLSSQYLGQIFNILVKSNIVHSVRGKNGGYELSREPSQITALELIEILEGELEFTGTINKNNDSIHELFAHAETQLRKALNISLAELLVRQKEKNQVLTYSI